MISSMILGIPWTGGNQLEHGILFRPDTIASPQQVLQESDYKQYPPLSNLCEPVQSQDLGHDHLILYVS